jgi:membrane-associated phospholipid phosphatase
MAKYMTLIRTIRTNSAFFIPYIIFLLAGGFILSLWNKPDIHLFINKYHSPAFDYFFKYWTLIGLGWLIIPVVLLLSFLRFRYVIISIAAFILTFIINDTIKQILGAPRPAELFSQLHLPLYLVPGVIAYHWNSFPSGHSAVAFCLFCILALSTKYNLIKFICFIIAFLVAYSRMYLSEHFLIDVYIASIIGVTSALVTFSIAMKLEWLNKFSGIDKPLLRF